MLIKSTHPESQGDFVIIEDSDFDAKTMTVYVAETVKPKGKK